MDLHAAAHAPSEDKYLVSPGAAWFAFVMTIGLMIFDYVDRQIIVSLFPHLKAEWNLSDKQLGALVSIVSITVAVGGIPIALIADRLSRVKSIVVMAIVVETARPNAAARRSDDRNASTIASVAASKTQLRPGR